MNDELRDFIEEGLGVDEDDVRKDIFVVKDELQPVEVLQRSFK